MPVDRIADLRPPGQMTEARRPELRGAMAAGMIGTRPAETDGLVRHGDDALQCLSIKYARRLFEAGI